MAAELGNSPTKMDAKQVGALGYAARAAKRRYHLRDRPMVMPIVKLIAIHIGMLIRYAYDGLPDRNVNHDADRDDHSMAMPVADHLIAKPCLQLYNTKLVFWSSLGPSPVFQVVRGHHCSPHMRRFAASAGGGLTTTTTISIGGVRLTRGARMVANTQVYVRVADKLGRSENRVNSLARNDGTVRAGILAELAKYVFASLDSRKSEKPPGQQQTRRATEQNVYKLNVSCVA
ncbi:MAG: hypothetical protein BJ554DRAFT_7887, partial [Olpidium bornovanus]